MIHLQRAVYYRPQTKVMFSQVFVCPPGGVVVGISGTRSIRWVCHLVLTPPPSHGWVFWGVGAFTPPPVTWDLRYYGRPPSTSGRYASYWNAFSFSIYLLVVSEIQCEDSTSFVLSRKQKRHKFYRRS